MDLVEREQQLAMLDTLLDEARQGKGQVALISGAVGCGKSALLARFAERSGGSITLVSATCSRAEQPVSMGVVDQLFRSPGLLPELSDRVIGRLAAAGLPGVDGGTRVLARTSVAYKVCTALTELAQRRSPVVVVIDDVQWADQASLEVMAFLRRRIGSSRIMVIFSGASPQVAMDSGFQAELYAQPGIRWLRLRPLSAGGVREVVRRRSDAAFAAEFAVAYHRASGGNPLLLHALLTDHHGACPADRLSSLPIVVGETFTRTVLACLHRCEPQVLETARVLAALPDDEAVNRSRRLVEMNAHESARSLAVLAAMGLVEERGAFREPATRMVVLASLSPIERVSHHIRSARLLYREAASVTLIASQLLLAGEAPDPWSTEVLLDAASHEDDPGRALDYVDLAFRTADDDRKCALVTTALARIDWRANPAAAVRRLPAMQDALKQGHLSTRDAGALVRYLVWHGRNDAATTVWSLLTGTSGECPSVLSPELRAAHLWMQYVYPPLRVLLDRSGTVEVQETASVQDLRVLAATALIEVLAHGPDDESVVNAEHVLEVCRLSDSTVEWLLVAILTLIYSGRLETAARWCDCLLDEARVRQVLTWQAILSAASADVALRTGDTEAAMTHANAALSLIPLDGWGVAIGYPLASLLTAAVITGRVDEITADLWDAVPDRMFGTGFGVQYLSAHAYYLLATSRPHAALEEFRRCGRLIDDLRMDNPLLVAWRHGAAESCLMLGDFDEARLLLEQEAELPGATGPGVRGGMVRLLAATMDRSERVSALREAVELLEESGNRIELMCALAQLANAHGELREFGRAKLVAGRAKQLAKVCGATLICDHLLAVDLTRSRRSRPDDPVDHIARAALSDAELRVADLASRGMTNREISVKLFLTISTVEQHLTRIYRKLGIRGRAEMVAVLQRGSVVSRSLDKGVS